MSFSLLFTCIITRAPPSDAVGWDPVKLTNEKMLPQVLWSSIQSESSLGVVSELHSLDVMRITVQSDFAWRRHRQAQFYRPREGAVSTLCAPIHSELDSWRRMQPTVSETSGGFESTQTALTEIFCI